MIMIGIDNFLSIFWLFNNYEVSNFLSRLSKIYTLGKRICQNILIIHWWY